MLVHATGRATGSAHVGIRRLAATVFIALVLSFDPSPVEAHHGPKWIELLPAGDILIAVDDDNDGIFNNREGLIGTDPDSVDTDDDGFYDLFEDSHRAFGFDPLEPSHDSDRDGLTDRLEAEIGTDPERQDTDRDTFGDFDEVLNERFGYDPRRPNRDLDFDGIADRRERRSGSSPRLPDSNGDGVGDFELAYEGINPMLTLEEGHLGEIVGSTYSRRMAEAIVEMRFGAEFPPELAVELPYPVVTQGLYGPRGDEVPPRAALLADAPAAGDPDKLPQRTDPAMTPSAALLQSGVAGSGNIPYITAIYPTYNQIVSQLRDIAQEFDGSPNPKLVRLFYWSEPTEGHRYIYALKISDNPQVNEDEREMLFMGLHHGNELITANYTMALIRRLTQGYVNGDPAIQARVASSEIWVIPVVNPDGYSMAQSEFAHGANVKWRKNIRKVLEQSSLGGSQTEANKGVDPNRNYDFSHMRTLSVAQRNTLDGLTCASNGLWGGYPQPSPPVGVSVCEPFRVDRSTYPGAHGFSDVEARSVRMLADDQFQSGHEVDGMRCSLSWHSGAVAAVISPLNHNPLSSVTVTQQDAVQIDKLGNAYSAATGLFYYSVGNPWWQASPNHYQAFGTSDDWLYTHNGIFPITVEGNPGGYFEETALGMLANVGLNMSGAIAFMSSCDPLRGRLP